MIRSNILLSPSVYLIANGTRNSESTLHSLSTHIVLIIESTTPVLLTEHVVEQKTSVARDQ